ncbi:hypothetical protein [Amedibacterium intestinale]|uniref:TMEM164 family acyltransferase n=1 Tax=Amedibacterium intestinale TaxID=2583452 RepID=UPI003993125B
MKDFFTFYTDIKDLQMPFQAFGIYHVLFLILSLICIFLLYKHYIDESIEKKNIFLKRLGYYLLVEEIFYTLWLLWKCHDQLLVQIIPLELCSITVYINVLGIFTRKDYFRYFSCVVGLFAGGIAMLYPANIDGLYSAFSYRTINFYMLHASFVLLSLIYVKECKFTLKAMLRNIIGVCCLFTFAYFVNKIYGTQYMFVGSPPTIGIVRIIYDTTGPLFLLCVYGAMVLLHILELPFLLKLQKRMKEESYLFKNERKTDEILYNK